MLSAMGADLIRALNPAWLAVTLMLDLPWRKRWRRAVHEADALQVGLDVTFVAASPTARKNWGDDVPVPRAGVVRVHAYDLRPHVTTPALANALHEFRERILVWHCTCGWRFQNQLR